MREFGDEDAILVAGAARLGAFSGSGGAAGATFAARRLRKRDHELDIVIEKPCDETFAQVIRAVGALGTVIEAATPVLGVAMIRGVIGAGYMNVNPAVVTVSMTAKGVGQTAVHIRGAAKEGLISQRTAQKAAERLAGLLG
ncbi:MAG TPA: hypothetical protein VGI66_18000 [Streptosporangiaceae bacterium]|jgi:hypothetical protein